MKIALVHDDLVQWGGLERVLLGIAEIFPEAPIFTSLLNKKNKILLEKLKGKKVITSFFSNIPGAKSLYKPLLPLYPLMFEQFDLSGFDVIISVTTRFAKSVIVKPHQTHICYCYTPPRFLWNFPSDPLPNILKPLLSLLRIEDRVSANRVDYWIAGSKVARERIKKVYRADSLVVPGFVDFEEIKNIDSWNGGYFLIIARLNNYKRVDLAVKVFNELKNLNLKIVGEGPRMASLLKEAGPNVEFLGRVSEDLRLNLLAGARALIVTCEEDFGLTPLEAQALGKPVIAYKKGGVLETVVEGKTGVFFEAQEAESLREAVENFLKKEFDPEICIDQAKKFSKKDFKRNFRQAIDKLWYP